MAEENANPAPKKRGLWKKLLLLLAILVVAFAAVVALQPSEFHVTRSATIDAAPKAVFAQVDKLRNWETWSRWSKKDPNVNIKAVVEKPAPKAG